jgi:predicted nucleic acid-binding protein
VDAIVAVTNTTPLIALAGIEQLALLDRLFDRIVVPIEVWTELTAIPDATEPAALLALERVTFAPAPPAPPEAIGLDPPYSHASSG